MPKAFFKNPKNLIFLGAFLFIFAFILSLYTMYYSSPRFELKRSVDVALKNNSLELLNFVFPRDIGERVYYNLDLKSTKPFSVTLDFMDKEGIVMMSKKFLSRNSLMNEKGSVLLYRSPYSLKILLEGSSGAIVSGEIHLRYSIINISFLAVFSIGSAIFSLVGMGFLAFGVYGYLIEREFEKRKKKKISRN